MAYMLCLGRCYTCHQFFHFNPDLVPSLPANLTSTGEKEPVCRGCILAANPKRIKNGLPPIQILPGAYDEQEVP